ncbi:L-threonylcarbamoyladenylate synthase [Actinomyces vulturis]|uniref:L-threonylcarbamoyladenylate synthase n=1 Tax=Actinomyces vulturis TaxID=1857645 RepID=UPI000A3E2E4B|nr:L-threonylcarbamoyladenylate synthase [Actinomyces vulturis]
MSESLPPPSAPTVAQAVEHVRAGGLLVMPTDTVYGIGASARDAEAVARVLEAKGRGRHMPPPVLVSRPDDVDLIAAAVPAAAQALMEAFWPGALTIILDAHPSLTWDLGETGGTIAVRMPDHPMALEILKETGPMAVTSANLTGQPPATSSQEARDAFGERVGMNRDQIMVMEAEPTPGPVPSTIVNLSGDHGLGNALTILRHGVISPAELHQALAHLESFPACMVERP